GPPPPRRRTPPPRDGRSPAPGRRRSGPGGPPPGRRRRRGTSRPPGRRSAPEIPADFLKQSGAIPLAITPCIKLFHDMEIITRQCPPVRGTGGFYQVQH